MVAIVTDSTADLPTERSRQLGITIVPLEVRIDGASFEDGTELPPGAFYEKLRSAAAIPTTSQPPAGRFKEAYSAIEADEIVSLHISAKLSGTFNSARVAAEETPGKHIEVADSGGVSFGLGYLAEMAAEAAAGGASLAEICELIEENKPKMGFFAVLDTLQHAQRSGRISFAQALLGSMLQIKPIITLRDGAVQQVERPRTLRKALERMVELTAEAAPLRHLAVVHADNEPAARDLAGRLTSVFDGNIEVVPTGAVVGTHCGPGAVATCYIRT